MSPQPQPPRRSRVILLACIAACSAVAFWFSIPSSKSSIARQQSQDTTPKPGSAPGSSTFSGSAPAATRPATTSLAGADTPLATSDINPEVVSRSDTGLLFANRAASETTDDAFRRLVDEANMAAAKGGNEEERQAIAALIAGKNFEQAAIELLEIASRPGGVSTFTDTDLPKALRAAGRAAEAKEFERQVGLRTLDTLERMDSLGLGAAAPVVFDITFWRANQYLEKGTPEWRRAYESLARVAEQIPANSAAKNAGYVRSLGAWARQVLSRATPPPPP